MAPIRVRPVLRTHSGVERRSHTTTHTAPSTSDLQRIQPHLAARILQTRFRGNHPASAAAQLCAGHPGSFKATKEKPHMLQLSDGSQGTERVARTRTDFAIVQRGSSAAVETRIQILHELGRRLGFDDISLKQLLISLMTSPNEPPAIRDAAAQCLEQSTFLEDCTNDLANHADEHEIFTPSFHAIRELLDIRARGFVDETEYLVTTFAGPSASAARCISAGELLIVGSHIELFEPPTSKDETIQQGLSVLAKVYTDQSVEEILRIKAFVKAVNYSLHLDPTEFEKTIKRAAQTYASVDPQTYFGETLIQFVINCNPKLAVSTLYNRFLDITLDAESRAYVLEMLFSMDRSAAIAATLVVYGGHDPEDDAEDIKLFVKVMNHLVTATQDAKLLRDWISTRERAKKKRYAKTDPTATDWN